MKGLNLCGVGSGRSRAGMTLVEVVIAGAISTVVVAMLVGTYTLSARFSAQGFTETRLIHQSVMAIEKMTRTLNHACRSDSANPAYAFTIAPDFRSIDFTVPVEGGFERLRYRFDEQSQAVVQERQQAGGGFAQIGTDPLAENVGEFFVENQEGILSLVMTLQVNMNRNGKKQYTMVGRALPRNL